MNERFDFDALAQDVARGLSRREALRRLGLGLAAGLFAELTGWLPTWPTARAEAAAVAPSLGLCFPEIVTKGSLTSWLTFSITVERQACLLCPSTCCGGSCSASGVCCNNVCCQSFFPQGCCNNVCTDLTTTSHCGACGNVCGVGANASRPDCCAGSCTDRSSDRSNCGRCGQSCLSNESCQNGQCVACRIATDHPCGQVCCASTQICCPGSVNAPCCDPGKVCCGKVCADLSSDPNNCGTCGTACGSGRICTNHVCCGPGQTGCAGACANLTSDANNCGACGHACPTGESCANGRCTCGSLGSDCPGGEICTNGICCRPGQTGCNGTCVNLQTDPNNCKVCGNVCPNLGQNTQGVCNGGVCSVVCAPGYTFCTVSGTSGACVDLQRDNDHCGDCHNSCTLPNVTCCGGTCTDLLSDSHNCNDCGHVCGSTLGVRHPCVAGNCIGG